LIVVLLQLLMVCGISLAASTALAQEVTITGWFHVIWSDSSQGQAEEDHFYAVTDDLGGWFRLTMDEQLARPFGGPLALNGKRVRISGRRIESAPLARRLRQPARIAVESIAFVASNMHPAPGLEALSGPQPWVNILCKFSDVDAEPQAASWVEAEMGDAYPGMNHYWKLASENQINIDGTQVTGWYTLPQQRSYYVYDQNGDGVDDVDLVLLATDCTGAADADVYFPDFVGVNMMFNDLLDCCAWGGGIGLDLDGEFRGYRATWLPPWGYENIGVIAHEMGHGFGLPHSSGPYSATYDSRWDVMSSVWGNCPPHHPSYGCVGVHTISYHKDMLDWVPPTRNYVVDLGTVTTITLERLGEPTTTDDYLMAQIPIDGSVDEFYTVEARRLAGYDATLPGDAVILHKVMTYAERPARVVDPDGDGDPNDESAMWLPGETFVDELADIRVTVDAQTATGFVVTLENQPASILLLVGAEETAAVAPGGRLSIPIIVDMSAAMDVNVAGLEFDLEWVPTKFSYVSTVPGPVGTVTLEESAVSSGQLTAAMVSATGATATFTLCTVELDALPLEGPSYVTAEVTAAQDELGNDILGSITERQLYVCLQMLGYLGDVTDDGAVDIIDAQQVARYLVGLDALHPELMADLGDVTEDGQLNIIDAQQIARYSVALETPAAPHIGDPVPGPCIAGNQRRVARR
jgi:hypothetical protein